MLTTPTPQDARDVARAFADLHARGRLAEQPKMVHEIYLRHWRIAYEAKLAELARRIPRHAA